MSSLRHPVGPEPSQVYWRRRLAALVVIVLVVGVIAVGLAKVLGGGGGDKGADAGTTPAAETPATDPSTAPSTDASGAQPTACTPDQVAVAVSADAASYAAGVNPTFVVTITNSSSASCTLDAGEAARELLITSGSDRIWSSKDCPAEPAERLLLLPAGGKDDQTIAWQRIRSAPGCTAGLPAPRPGTYQAVVTVAGATSAPVVLQLG